MNAKDELQAWLDKCHKVKCASVGGNPSMDEPTHHLSIGYSRKEFKEFMNSLDFEYDSGYGSQKLYGTVWFVDGTWLERFEYDGSECWTRPLAPVIPDCLL